MSIIISDSSAKTKILRAIMSDPEIVLLLKEKYVDDEIWKFCIERDPNLFKKMKHPNDEICMYACTVDGANLKHIKNKFRHIKITNAMCLASVESNPRAILYVPRSMINNELKENACMEDPSLIIHIDDLQDDFIEKVIKEKPYAVKYVRKVSESFLCEMIKTTPTICTYFNKMTPKMIDVFRTCHPNYFTLYKGNIKCADENVGEKADA